MNIGCVNIDISSIEIMYNMLDSNYIILKDIYIWDDIISCLMY